MNEELEKEKEKNKELSLALASAITMLDDFNNMHGDQARTVKINELDTILKLNS